MAKNAKITRQQIVDAAIETLRQKVGINARNVASVLHASTQPIYSVFKNMEELKVAIRQEAIRIQKEKVVLYFAQDGAPKYKAYGMGFVRFAKDESELFKFVYMQEPNDLFAGEQDQLYDEIIFQMQNVYGFSKKDAKDFHLDMSIYTYGLAVMQSLGRNISDEEVADRLKKQFMALSSRYGLKSIIPKGEKNGQRD